jgi:hypothetical protein
MRNQDRSIKAAVNAAIAAGRCPTVVNDPNTKLTHRETLSHKRVHRVHDSLQTYDQQAFDSAGVFMIGELERLDQELHMPLIEYTWGRDIDTRTDVTMADEISSFTNSNFAVTQGIPGSNKSWSGKTSTAIAGLGVDIGKTTQPLPIWAMEVSWTIPELLSAARLGRPLDTQMFEFMQEKWQMDVDEETYMGDSVLGMNGMFNHTSLTNTGNAVNGLWASASPAQILADINSLLTSVYTTAGTKVVPNRLLLSPTEYTLLVSTLISTAGTTSILKFVLDNNATLGVGAEPLKIFPCKWLVGTGNTLGGVAGKGPTTTNSMYAYDKNRKRIRMPIVPLQRTPIEPRGIRQITTYFGRLGGVEMVYPETCGRRSNLA